MQRLRSRPGRAAEDLRCAAFGLPRVRPGHVRQASHGRRLPIEGLGLVCHRLPQRAGRRQSGRRLCGQDRFSRQERLCGPRRRPCRSCRRDLSTRRHTMRAFKKHFITGLLVWIPLAITLWVLGLLVATLEGFVPGFLSAQSLFGIDIPGFRFALVIAVVLLTGVFAANLLGRTLLEQWEALLGRIPLVRSIYNSVKQVSDTVLAPNGQAFRQAVLAQYPRAGCWTIAFLTGAPGGGIAGHLAGEHVSVYVPTTPNPTSGFFLMMPRDQVVALQMSVDAALKYIVSMGVVAPPAVPAAAAAPIPMAPAVDS